MTKIGKILKPVNKGNGPVYIVFVFKETWGNETTEFEGLQIK